MVTIGCPGSSFKMNRDTAMQLARSIRQIYGDDPIETALKGLRIDAVARHTELLHRFDEELHTITINARTTALMDVIKEVVTVALELKSNG